MNTRRTFFENLALLGTLAALTDQEAIAEPQDGKLSDFWDAYFEEATRDPANGSRGAADDSNLLDPTRKVQLIQATNSGLRYPDAISDTELHTASDVVVTVNPGHFRPAQDDARAVAKSRGAQIRLDWVQTRPIMNLLAPMAWAGLAAWGVEKRTVSVSPKKDASGKPVLDSSGKQEYDKKVTAGPTPPELAQLDFRDPNDPKAAAQNQVILPGGSGRMALNVRAVSVNPKLKAALDKGVSYASIVSPFFGFAPLAIPALKAFTQLLGAVFNHEAVIMNSLPLQVLATQDATKHPHQADSTKIVSGDFIAVP